MKPSPTSTTPDAPSDTTALVVTDWGWLISQSTDSLPTGVDYVIPDVVVPELLGAWREDPTTGAARAAKLVRILRQNADRLWVGHWWDWVSRMEHSPDVVLTSRDIVNYELTGVMRTSIGRISDDCREQLTELAESNADADHEERRRQFIERCEFWSAVMRSSQGDELTRMGGNPEAQTEWIQRPGQVVEEVIRHMPRFDTTEWRRALDCFPDRVAAARWMRIILWYTLMRSLSPERDQHRFGNDYDDAHYGFLASYTGHLAAADRGLRRMVAAVFPRVEVQD